MSTKPSKCIVIGGGRIALSHIPHILDHPLCDLVGIVEPNRILRFVLRRIFRLKVYRSLELVKFNEFDSAFVLTPPKSHFSLAQKLLTNSKHVFLEKPMTLDPKDSAELLSMAKKNKVQLFCGYVYRHHPIYKEIKRLLDCNEYGVPITSDISMRGNVVSSNSVASWRSSGRGSGCIYDYGCHVIDLSFFLFGKPKSVICLSKEDLYHPNVIDRFSAELIHSKFFDVKSTIICDWADETVRKAGITLHIKTKHHNIFTDGQTITITGETSKSYSIKDVDTNVNFYLRGEEFQNQTNEFFTAISNQQDNYLAAEDAVLVDEAILKIYEQAL